MNKNIFKTMMETVPETTHQQYIFIVDSVDLALNIMTCEYNAVALQKENDAFFDLDGLLAYLDEIVNLGKQRSNYVYVPACSTKKINDALEEYFKKEYLNCRQGWRLFAGKGYLEKSEALPELKRKLNRFVESYEKIPDTEPDLDAYHILNGEGKPTSVCDLAIAEKIYSDIPFFVLGGETIFIYQNGVYREDVKGVQLRRKIQSLMYRRFVKAPTVQRVLTLLITMEGVQKQFSDLYNFPAQWINFKNGFYDPVGQRIMPHDPKYLSINQIPFSFEPEKWKSSLPSGDITEQFLANAVPNKEDQQMVWEYLGYCMTTDTQMQKFLMLLGNGGTGKSVLISVFQNIISPVNCSGISLQNLNERFYPTSLFGKLLNACGDIPCREMKSTDVLKKVVGEDAILYEKKSQDPLLFFSHAKLLFSANAMPENLDDKSDAFSRRLMVLEMNHAVPAGRKDPQLKSKLRVEADYAICMAMKALHEAYERGYFTQSENCKLNVEKIQRASDSVKAFVDEKLEHRDGVRIERSSMYKMYTDYCEEYGRRPLGKSKFIAEMERKGFQITKYCGVYKFKDVTEREEEFQSAEGEDIPFD